MERYYYELNRSLNGVQLHNCIVYDRLAPKGSVFCKTEEIDNAEKIVAALNAAERTRP